MSTPAPPPSPPDRHFPVPQAVGWLELFYNLVFVAAIVTFSDAVSFDPEPHVIAIVFAATAYYRDSFGASSITARWSSATVSRRRCCEWPTPTCSSSPRCATTHRSRSTWRSDVPGEEEG